MSIATLQTVGDVIACDLLATALVAGIRVAPDEYVSMALELSTRRDGPVASAAYAALGRADISADADLLQTTVAHLTQAVRTAEDDQTLASRLTALVDCYATAPDQIEDQLLGVLAEVPIDVGPLTQHRLVQTLVGNADTMSEPIHEAICRRLHHIEPANNLTLQLLDGVFGQAESKIKLRLVADTLDHILDRGAGALGLENFPIFKDRLLRQDRSSLVRVYSDWMLKGSFAARQSIAGALNRADFNRPLLHVELGLLHLSDAEIVFIARKTIGYLFSAPLEVAAFLVSASCAVSVETRGEIMSLLYDPVLVSYPATVRPYLESLTGDCDSTAPRQELRELVGQLDRYLETISAADEIRELHPSARERRLARDRIANAVATAKREEEDNSAFASLVSRVQILFGAGTVRYSPTRNSTLPARIETPMQTISYSVERPRLACIDPVGLDLQLTVFRNEKQPE